MFLIKHAVLSKLRSNSSPVQRNLKPSFCFFQRYMMALSGVVTFTTAPFLVETKSSAQLVIWGLNTIVWKCNIEFVIDISVTTATTATTGRTTKTTATFNVVFLLLLLLSQPIHHTLITTTLSQKIKLIYSSFAFDLWSFKFKFN